MTNQNRIFFKKTLIGNRNLRIVVLLLLVFLASCINNKDDKEGKATEPSIVKNDQSNSNSESQNYNAGVGEIYQSAENMPEFIGGIKEFSSFLKDNIIYPAWEKEQKIEGKVFVTFVVEKDGSISNLNAVRVPDGSKNLANEAIRVLSLMPKWILGETEGEKVRVSYTVPIVFKIP